MKSKFFVAGILSMALVFGMMLFVGCKNDDDGGDGPAGGTAGTLVIYNDSTQSISQVQIQYVDPDTGRNKDVVGSPYQGLTLTGERFTVNLDATIRDFIVDVLPGNLRQNVRILAEETTELMFENSNALNVQPKNTLVESPSKGTLEVYNSTSDTIVKVTLTDTISGDFVVYRKVCKTGERFEQSFGQGTYNISITAADKAAQVFPAVDIIVSQKKLLTYTGAGGAPAGPAGPAAPVANPLLAGSPWTDTTGSYSIDFDAALRYTLTSVAGDVLDSGSYTAPLANGIFTMNSTRDYNWIGCTFIADGFTITEVSLGTTLNF